MNLDTFVRIGIYILIFIAFLPLCHAAQVRKLDKSGSLVSIKGLVVEKWQMNEHLCLKRGKYTVACGQVIRIQPAGIVAQLTMQLVPFINKEDLKIVKVIPTSKGLASLLGVRESVLEKKSASEVTSFSLGVLTVLGIWPFAHIETGIDNRLSMGFMPSYFDLNTGTSGMTGFGFHATTSYYFQRLFRGPYAMAAVGMNVFTPKTSIVPAPRTLSFSGMLSVGWKFLVSPNWSLGVSAGGSYFTNARAADFSHSGFLLNFIAGAAYLF